VPDATVGGGNVVKVEPEAKLRMKSQIIAGAASGERTDSPSARSDVIAASAGGGAAGGSLRKVAGSGSFGFRHMGGDRIHQGWRQAIIGLKSEFLET
jgi:hypothetical protein